MQDLKEVLTIQDLSVGYDRALLKGVSFSVRRGDRILLDGPSGCGKTSLLRSLLGLPAPIHGTVWIGLQRLEQASVWTLRQQLGYVPQEPDLGSETVQDFFDRAFSYHANRSIHPEENELCMLMDRWLLPRPLLKKSCQELSGGEKQRAAIILTILLKRKILLLDEPTSALDKNCRRILYAWIRDSEDLTFLMVTHEPGLRETAGQRIDLDSFRTEAAHD